MPSDPSSFYARSTPDQPVEPHAGQRSAYLRLLGNSNFRYWFLSSLISSIGDWMGFVALSSIMAGLYGNSSSQLAAVGGLLLIRLAPSVFFGPVAGVIADRYNRHTVLVATDIARFAIYMAIALWARDAVAIFALTFIVECVSLLFGAAKDSSLPAVAEDPELLTEANQLNLFCSYGTLPLGSFSAAVMVGIAAFAGQFLPFEPDALRLAVLIDAMTFLVSAALLYLVTIPGEKERHRQRKEVEEPPGIWDELKVGLEFIAGFPLLRALIVGIIGVFFGAGVLVGLGPVWIIELGQQEDRWSFLLSVFGGGLLAGILVLVPLLRRYTQEKVFPIMLIATGVMAVIAATSVNFNMALVTGAVLGAVAGVAVVQGYTLLMVNTENDTRARTIALFYAMTRVSLFASLAVGPWVAAGLGEASVTLAGKTFSATGTRVVLILGGVIALIFGIRTMLAIRRASADNTDTVALTKPSNGHESGLFVSFEGVEGSGKSTQINRLAATLREEGFDVLVTREPGGAPLAEEIRELVLDPENKMSGRTEAMLIAAARSDHVDRTIRPALDAHKIVLCDRFIDSSLAYQGYARKLGIGDVGVLNRWAVDGVVPDAVVWLRLDPETGMERLATREDTVIETDPTVVPLNSKSDNAELDRMEQEDAEFHDRVAKGYRELSRTNNRYVVVEADKTPDEVAVDVRQALSRWIPLPGSDVEPETVRTAGDDSAKKQSSAPSSKRSSEVPPIPKGRTG